jgi:hypothetical protein
MGHKPRAIGRVDDSHRASPVGWSFRKPQVHHPRDKRQNARSLRPPRQPIPGYNTPTRRCDLTFLNCHALSYCPFPEFKGAGQ